MPPRTSREPSGSCAMPRHAARRSSASRSSSTRPTSARRSRASGSTSPSRSRVRRRTRMQAPGARELQVVLIVPDLRAPGAGRLSQLGGRSSTPTAACSACIARCTSPTTRCSTRSTTSRRARRRASGCGRRATRRSASSSAGISGIRRRRASRACSAPRSSSIRRRLAGIRPRKTSGARRRSTPGARRSARTRSPTASSSPPPNRIGHEDEPGTKGITFFGRSFIADPFGRYLADAGEDEEILIARCDPALIEDDAPQLAVPARPPRRRLRSDSQQVPRFVTPTAGPLRMPAEWEPHRATWISWPHHEPDWPGKLGADSLGLRRDRPRACRSRDGRDPLPQRRTCVTPRRRRSKHTASGAIASVSTSCPTDRVWLRDSAPTGVHDAAGDVVLLSWGFNAWAKYDNWRLDAQVAGPIARHRAVGSKSRAAPTTASPIVLEGGGIDVERPGPAARDRGVAPQRRPGAQSRADARRLRSRSSGSGSASGGRSGWAKAASGDDTHGHIDDIARFVSADTIVLAVEEDPSDDNHERSMDNLRRLELAPKILPWARFASSSCPFPRPVTMNGERLPASYANFYIAQRRRDRADVQRRQRSRRARHPGGAVSRSHEVVGIHAVDLVWGLGTLHCLTQQEPAPRKP